MKNLLLISILFIISFSSFSQDGGPIFTDRPNATDAAQLLYVGDFQAEIGFFSDTDKNNTTNRSITQPNISLKYGILHWLEVRVLSNLQTTISDVGGINENRTTGITALTISPKFKLYEGEGFLTHLALGTSFILPKTGHTAFQNNNLNVGYRLLMNNAISDKISWSHSFGTDWDDNANDSWIYTSSFGFTLTDQLGAFTELYGTFSNVNAYYLDAGLSYLILNNLSIDTMIGAGLNDNASDYLVSFGFAWKTNFKK